MCRFLYVISKTPFCPWIHGACEGLAAPFQPAALSGLGDSVRARTGVLVRPVRAMLHTIPAEAPGDTAAVSEDSRGAAPPPRAAGRAGSPWEDRRTAGMPHPPGHSLALQLAIAPTALPSLTQVDCIPYFLQKRESRLPNSAQSLLGWHPSGRVTDTLSHVPLM